MGSSYLFDIPHPDLGPSWLWWRPLPMKSSLVSGMAAPIAAIFVPRVGSATIGEVLAALAEVLMVINSVLRCPFVWLGSRFGK